MSPLKLINHSHSPSHVEQSIASNDAQRSDSACFAGSNSTESGQVKRYISLELPLQVVFLADCTSAEPSTQLFLDKTRSVELVELPPGDETGSQLMSGFRLSNHRGEAGQQSCLPLDNELHDHNSSVAPASTGQEVSGEDKDCEVNFSAIIRAIEKQKKCRRNRRERNRIALMEFAYETLKSRIPPEYLPRQKRKLSKLKILTLATEYIRNLTDLLAQEEEFAREKPTSPAGVCRYCQCRSKSVD